MSDKYSITRIYPGETDKIAQIDNLLEREGIRRDANLDYTCAMYDSNDNIIATGSCFANTLRCVAVSDDRQGEGLLAELIFHLVNIQFERGNTHLFVYTKPDAAILLATLGFYEIARVSDTLVFMENRRSGFADYLKSIKKSTQNWLINNTSQFSENSRIASIVMNANPFTLGHQYLVEEASSKCDILHIFVLSEEASIIPFEIRKSLVEKGCEHLHNVCIHSSGPYIISNATFPSYFLKEETSVIRGHALLDIAVFSEISKSLNISERYVGEEPMSLVTNIYNQLLEEQLSKQGIACNLIPRKVVGNDIISASTVRACIKNNDFDTLRTMVPDSTYNYFTSNEAIPVITKIRNSPSDKILHY